MGGVSFRFRFRGAELGRSVPPEAGGGWVEQTLGEGSFAAELV